jgi:negative modulator of initiation of replication
MRIIEVTDDIYSYLLSKAEIIGEDASSILRRLLEIEVRPRGSDANVPSSEFADFLQSPEFQRQRTATHQFLSILGELHRRRPDAFDRVLTVTGRKREYFGRSRADLASSGRNVEPQSIPDSPYWVMTNASTSYKRRILSEVMTVLGYPKSAQAEIARVLGTQA